MEKLIELWVSCLKKKWSRKSYIQQTTKLQPMLHKALSETAELQNTIELRATGSEIAGSKPDLDARAKKRRFWSTFEKDF